jgi:hypothetical protein
MNLNEMKNAPYVDNYRFEDQLNNLQFGLLKDSEDAYEVIRRFRWEVLNRLKEIESETKKGIERIITNGVA